MKTGILITARLGSTRLKKKHLLAIDNVPIIQYLIKRIHSEFKHEIDGDKVKIFIATTEEPENKEFERFAGPGIAVFYGNKNNIPLRHLQTAQSNFLDRIISIDGDDILCSPKGMRLIYEAFCDGKCYVRTVNLPFGMNSWGYSVDFLQESLSNHQNDVLETGWGRIFDEKMVTDIPVSLINNDDRLRFTLDYIEDFHLFEAIAKIMGDDIYTANDEEIINIVLNNNITDLNSAVTKRYWDNFNKIKQDEIDSSQGKS